MRRGVSRVRKAAPRMIFGRRLPFTDSQLAQHGKMAGFTFNVEAVEVQRGIISRHDVCSPSDSFSSNHLKKSQHLEAFYLSSALPVPLNQQNRSYFDKQFDHGLVHACLISFTQHKRLVLRPDDIFFPLVDAAATHVLNQGIVACATFVSFCCCNFILFCRRERP